MSTRRFQRLRRPGGRVLVVALLALLALGVFLGSALAPADSESRSGGVASEGPKSVDNPLAGRIDKVVGTETPAARYGEEVAALEDYEENLAGEKISELSPLPPRRFKAPIREYKAYAKAWVGRTIDAARALENSLYGGSRARARQAWEETWADYGHLGADYGLFGKLEEEIDGTGGGLQEAVSDPSFGGFHRLEWGIWTGRPLGSLAPYGRRLVADLTRLRAAIPKVKITPLDYATRSHEILEDAQRDLLSGMDVPWSHQGVLGTAAALEADEELFRTLKPLLSGRENTEGEVENWLVRLRGVFASLRGPAGYPSTTRLGTLERERLNGSIAGALSALSEMPGTLETRLYKPPPSIASGR